MIRTIHGRASTVSLGFVVLYLVLVAVGAVFFVPAVTTAIRLYNYDPVMGLFTLFGAAGWIVSMIWFTWALRIKA